MSTLRDPNEYDPERNPVYVMVGPVLMTYPTHYAPEFDGEMAAVISLGGMEFKIPTRLLTPVPDGANESLTMQWVGAFEFDTISAGSCYAEAQNDHTLRRLYDSFQDYVLQVRRFRRA